jgi:phosphate transport system substrate-binding protein
VSGKPPAAFAAQQEGAHVDRSTLRRRATPPAVVLTLALTLAACGGADAGPSPQPATGASDGAAQQPQELSGSVRVDGSSTVEPLTSAAAELFQEQNPGVRVTVGTSGTGGGFEKFCQGETDISDASRPIEDDEAQMCEENGVEYDEFTVANDALTVVVNSANDFAQCLTTDQLAKIWEPGSKVNNWKDLDPSFPDQDMKLFGPGTDSGTFDYFTEAINGEEGASRTDYSPSEDDNVIVQGVAGSEGGLGYFGYTFFEENQDKLTAVAVDSGNGCVPPSPETAQNGEYTPLSRPLFIYPSTKALESPAGEAFVTYYVENVADIAEQAQFIPLNDEQQQELQGKLEQLTQ